MSYIYDKYRIGKSDIDYENFIKEIYALSSSGAYTNALRCAGLDFLDPYAYLKMAMPLNLDRVRSGESKYLIRELFKMKYSTLSVPEKLPMSRPANAWLSDWAGPARKEFLPNCVEKLTGEQKLLVYSLEQFFNVQGIE